MSGYQPLPRPYELMVLINPEVTDDALTQAVDEISALITNHGGQVTGIKRDTPWGRRRLAYPIQRYRDATYVLYYFTGVPSRVIEIERELKLDQRVIRYLMVRQDEATAAAVAAAAAEEAQAAEAQASEPTEAAESAEAAESEEAAAPAEAVEAEQAE